MAVEKIIVLAVLCAVLIVLLRNSRPEQAMILSLCAVILLLFWLLDAMDPILQELRQLTELFSFGSQQGELLLKSLGLCLLTQVSADLCRDAGENTLAVNVELAGKTAVLLLCLPLFRQLLSFAAELIR